MIRSVFELVFVGTASAQTEPPARAGRSSSFVQHVTLTDPPAGIGGRVARGAQGPPGLRRGLCWQWICRLNLLRTATHECALEAQEIKQIAHEWACGGVAITGVFLARDEAALEAEEVEEVEDSNAGRLGALVGAELD